MGRDAPIRRGMIRAARTANAIDRHGGAISVRARRAGNRSTDPGSNASSGNGASSSEVLDGSTGARAGGRPI